MKIEYMSNNVFQGRGGSQHLCVSHIENRSTGIKRMRRGASIVLAGIWQEISPIREIIRHVARLHIRIVAHYEYKYTYV